MIPPHAFAEHLFLLCAGEISTKSSALPGAGRGFGDGDGDGGGERCVWGTRSFFACDIVDGSVWNMGLGYTMPIVGIRRAI